MTEYRHSAIGRRVLESLVPVICPAEAHGLAAGFATYDLGSLPRYLRRAHTLPVEKAERYYESWVHGITPVHKQFAQVLNQMMSLSCYEQPAMMEAIGYRVGPWIEEVKKKRLSVFADDIKKQENQIFAPDPLRPDAPNPRARAKKEVA